MKKLLVFTDLDGSLLNHHDYSWSKAIPALKALENHDCPVILNSSKTVAEISKLRKQLNNNHPFVSENGAIVNIPLAYFPSCDAKKSSQDKLKLHYFGKSYDEITKTLQELRQEYGFEFKGFNDMSAEELGALCGLSTEQAVQAKQREASEPIVWMDTEDAFLQFKSLLNEKDFIVVTGGRFRHVMSDVDKGRSLLWLKEQYENAKPDIEWITVGLGDSYNDSQMLEVVDYPVLIPNFANTQPTLSHLKNLINPYSSGSKGWNEAILGLIDKLL